MNRIVYVLAAAFFALITSCKGVNKDELKAEIDQFEANVSELDRAVDTASANKIVRLYSTYANEFPDDSLAPIYLFKAADVLQGICEYKSAVHYYNRILDNYPDFDGRALSFFFKGRAYEQSAMIDSAIVVYEDFLELYPDHFLAEDTRKMLPMLKLGLNDQEQFSYIMEHSVDTTIVRDNDAK